MRRGRVGAAAVALLVGTAALAVPALPAQAAVTTGRVVDTAGRPVVGARVQGDFWLATTDANGRYQSPEMTFQAGAGYSVRARGAAGDPTYGYDQVVVPLADTGGAVPDLVLPAASSVTGTVTGPNGPVADVIVRISTPPYFTFPSPPACPPFLDIRAVTGADGRYRIDGLGRVDCPIWFEPPTGSGLALEIYDNVGSQAQATNLVITAGGTTRSGVDARLERAGTIAGRVLDAATGAPVVNGYVYVRFPDGVSVGGGGGPAAFPGADGRFSVTGLKPGPYDVFPAGGGYETLPAVRVVVPEGGTVTLPDFRPPLLAPVVITSFEPASIAPGSTVNLRVNGTGFRDSPRLEISPDAPVLVFNQLTVTDLQVVSPTLITARLSYHPTAIFSALDVVLWHPDGSSTVCDACIRIVTGPGLAQSLAFTEPPPVTAGVGVSFAVAARATTGLDVTLSAVGACTGGGLNRVVVTTTSAGSCTVRAQRAGDAAFAAAATVEASTAVSATPPPPVPGVQTIVTARPTRLLDTRPESRVGYDGAKPGPGATVTLAVAGAGGVPTDAAAVALNVTGTDASSPGYVTVWPCDEERPLASSLNLTPGITAPNAVITKVSAAGTVCLYTQGGAHLLADVTGWFPAGAAYRPQQPVRVLDTRPGSRLGYDGAGPVAGEVVRLPVAGTAGVPADASAVVLNVTGTDAAADGYVTVWPCGEERPLASSLNLVPGITSPNAVVSKLGPAGDVCLFTQSGAQLVVDVVGWFPAGSAYVPVRPDRLLDTRPGAPIAATGDKPAAGAVITLAVVGAGTPAVPANVSTVVLNVTGTEADADGYVTVWPCDTERPLASNLNLRPGATTPNAVITKLSAAGTVCLYTQSPAHLLADLTGYVTG